MRPLLNIALFAALFVALAAPARAGEQVYTSWGKAINGYDAVAYFKDHKPVEGDSDFTYEWMDAKWYFASAADRDAFARDPEKYAPQYGGYCAWAVSQGFSAKTDPDAWKIVGGKLYLNYSKDIQKKWEAGGIDKLIKAGDANWPAIRKKLEAE